jgi:hypothetical protein
MYLLISEVLKENYNKRANDQIQELQSEMECASSTILIAQLRMYVTISHVINIIYMS